MLANQFQACKGLDLNLSHNRLETLSKEINSIKNLTTLQLHDNKLTSLPEELCDLTELSTLTLKNKSTCITAK